MNREDTKEIGQAKGREDEERMPPEIAEPAHSDLPGRVGKKTPVYGNHEAQPGKERAENEDVPTPSGGQMP